MRPDLEAGMRPAGPGNMLGAPVFVALPFWYVFRPTTRFAEGGHR